jgi:4-hydroxybenzoate polyprenyltransferase
MIRPVNIPTVWADVLTGAILIRAAYGTSLRPNWESLFLLAGCSSFLYASGMVFNDIADREKDALFHPYRPLPASLVSLVAARRFVMLLSLAASACAYAAGNFGDEAWNPAPLVQAGIIFSAIFLYNFALKNVVLLGPLAMGLCRGFNMQLGMSGDPNFLAHWGDIFSQPNVWSAAVPWIPPAALCLYTAGVTILSKGEEEGLGRQTAFRGWLWMLTAGMVGYAALQMTTQSGGLAGASPWIWIAWGPLFLLLGVQTVWTRRDGSSREAKRLVLFGVSGIALFDAGLIFACGQAHAALFAGVCLLCAIPGILLGLFGRPFRLRAEA